MELRALQFAAQLKEINCYLTYCGCGHFVAVVQEIAKQRTLHIVENHYIAMQSSLGRIAEGHFHIFGCARNRHDVTRRFSKPLMKGDLALKVLFEKRIE